MDKKILVMVILGIFLLTNVNAISFNGNIGRKKIDDHENLYPVMRADSTFLDRYENDYSIEETAVVDSSLVYDVESTEDYSILDLLYYIPEERSQGGCGNCWAWPSTSVLGIALRVQENVLENRLSVQYINTCGELYATFPRIECCGGATIRTFASFYQKTGIAIPWSNENAHWQDYVIIGQCEQVECDEIAKYPNYPIGSIRSERITTHNVPEETAIENIKNILHQQRGVYFSVFYADDTDLNNFRSFWRNEDEEYIYDLDYYAGHPWVSEEAVGHALLIVGYHDDENTNESDYWIILNSWGTNNGGRPNGLLRVDMHMNYSLKYSTTYAFGAETLNVTFGSQVPITTITGPTSGRLRKTHTFQVSAVDPQEDDVYLYVNWGDGTNTDWMGPYASEEVITVDHKFSERQNYTIKAKAKDISGNEGPEQPLKITVAKSAVLSGQYYPLLSLFFKIYSFFTTGTITVEKGNPEAPDNGCPCNSR